MRVLYSIIFTSLLFLVVFAEEGSLRQRELETKKKKNCVYKERKRGKWSWRYGRWSWKDTGNLFCLQNYKDYHTGGNIPDLAEKYTGVKRLVKLKDTCMKEGDSNFENCDERSPGRLRNCKLSYWDNIWGPLVGLKVFDCGQKD